MPNIDDLLDAAAFPEKTVPVCLGGGLQSTFEDLERQIKALSEKPKDRLNDGTAAERRRLAEEIEAIREQMREHTIIVRFRGFGHHRWNQLLAEHAPRKDSADDKAVGYNVETFYSALVRETIYDPAFSDEQWERFDASVTSMQWDELVDAAIAVTRRRVDVPFSFVASTTLRGSSET